MGFFSRRGPVRPPHTQTTAVIPTSPPFQSPPPAYSQPIPQNSIIPSLEPQQNSNNLYGDDVEGDRGINATEDVAVQDAIIDQFSVIMAGIDEERNVNYEEDYTVTVVEQLPDILDHGYSTTRALVPRSQSLDHRPPLNYKQQNVTIWSKVSFYANSRLPADLPPLRVYIPTWPLICLAAQYSANVYNSPQSSQEHEAFVSADAGLGTKAMVLKSVPCDDKKVLVFAIRGTNMFSYKDWNINMRTAPVSPAGFLDDEGNLCHSGFLRVAKAMARPIAMRLRTLLEENPSRTSCSLVITGHSAGGAVAALLYSHMLSSIESELSILTGCFKRVHCIIFGAPPVSLLPLTKPADRKYNKSLFFSFINEGDPIVRAERAYLKSLANLLYSPLPNISSVPRKTPATSTIAYIHQSVSNVDLTLSKLNLTIPQARLPLNPLYTKKHSRWNLSHSALPNLSSNIRLSSNPASSTNSAPRWPLPTAALSNSGRLILLRVPHQEVQKRRAQQIQRTTSIRWERNNLSRVSAHTVADEQLRGVIFGDPSMHSMQVYLRRVEMLALMAVTARN